MNIRSIFGLFLLLSIGNLAFADTGIEFEEQDWDDVISRSEAEDKLIFLDAYASWCGPCKKMSRETFTDEAVAEFYNENFINAKIDMEKGVGLELAKQYGVRAYPTLLFINHKGEVVNRICGYMDAEAFLSLGKNTLSLERPMFQWEADMKAGKLNAEEMETYLEMVYNACSSTNEPAIQYLNGLKPADKVSKDNFLILSKYLSDIDSDPFKFLLDNIKAYKKNSPAKEVDLAIVQAYVNHGYRNFVRVKKFDPVAYKKFTDRVKSETGGLADRIILNLDVLKYDRDKEWPKMIESAKTLTQKYDISDQPDLLNRLADRVYEHSDDKDAIDRSVEWAAMNYKNTQNPIYHFTYAQVLFKSGNKDKAIVVMEGATALAEKEGYDTEMFLEYLAQIKE